MITKFDWFALGWFALYAIYVITGSIFGFVQCGNFVAAVLACTILFNHLHLMIVKSWLAEARKNLEQK